MSITTLMGLVSLLSEIALAVFKRANARNAQSADRGSLGLLWMVIGASVFLAYVLPANMPSLRMSSEGVLKNAGVVLFVAGVALRWYSIAYLGRFFTVDVAIAADHRVIDTGPYRYIRHPSYSGVLMMFIGLGLCLGNWASLAVLIVPTSMVFSWRIRVEEAALAQALGDRYRDYMCRTKRLIPAVY